MGRRNSAPWRRECEKRYGAWCRSCGESRNVELDHIIPRSQGGKDDVENGLFLCGPWGTQSPHPNGCHDAKTRSRMTICVEWLDPEQIEYLAEQGWVAWDEQGEPYGRGYRHFSNQE